MKNLKQKIMLSAIVSTLGVLAGSAQAAYLSDTNKGQVLIYPYYTAQNGFDTYISVVNATTVGKAVKVTLMESLAGEVVQSFNLYLPGRDTWVAAITGTPTGATLIVPDHSCTSPLKVSGDLSNSNYVNKTMDVFDKTTARTREGFVKVIEMGTVVDSVFSAAISQNAAGVPNNCPWVNSEWDYSDALTAPASLPLNGPTGGLFGSISLLNVKEGVDYAYDALAIEDFRFNATEKQTSWHTRSDVLSPTLQDASPVSAVKYDSGNGHYMVVSDWSDSNKGGRDAISALLSTASITNEYAVNTELLAGSDWVMTFPTKDLHVVSGATVADRPFSKASRVHAEVPDWTACEPISMKVYDREHAVANQPTTNTLCYQTNVLTFRKTHVLKADKSEIGLDNVPDNGIMMMSFTGASALMTSSNSVATNLSLTTGSIQQKSDIMNNSASYAGLPVIGFALQKYVNGNVGGVLSNYGGNFSHKYNRSVY